MLTLKAPIQLHIGQGLRGTSEAFGERIRSNYDLLSARFTPKDLLFLLTAPPEVPEETGGMTTLVSQQTQVDARSVTLDVVNNVINRILLDGTSQFTYQDQVYITSVLNRLGINNVEQFMAQVRQLRSETENTVHLTQLYRSELERVLRQQAAGEPAPQQAVAAEHGEEEAPKARDPKLSMSMEVLQRLETANLYETIHAFQRSWSVAENYFTRNEMRLAEQLRFSNVVALTQQRQQVFQYPQVHMLHHLNQYETGTILELPRDEEAVLSQAAVAALVTAVDNTVTEVLNRPQLRQEQWVRMENALWQTAENTLSRFETYHNYTQIPPEAVSVERERLYHHELSRLEETYLRERQMQDTLLRSERRAETAGRAPEATARQEEWPALVLPKLKLSHPETEEELPEESLPQMALTPEAQRTIREAMRALEEPGQVVREIQTAQEAAPTVHPEVSRDEEDEAQPPSGGHEAATSPLQQTRLEQTQIDQYQQTVLMEARQEALQKAAAQEHPAQETQRVIREVLRALEEPGQVLRETRYEAGIVPTVHPEAPSEEEETLAAPVVGESGEILPARLVEQQTKIQQQRQTVLTETQAELQQQSLAQEAAVQETQRTIREVLRVLEEPGQILREIPAEQGMISTVHPALSPEEEQALLEGRPVSESRDAASERLVQELNRIDQHNRTMIQNVQQEIHQRRSEVTTPVPDVRRTMKDALRALDAQDEVLREIYEERAAAPTVHPTLTVEEEVLLQQADPATRALYERVLLYQKDPEAALAKGLVRPGNLGALNADLQRAAAEAPMVLEHMETIREREELWHQSETVLEQFRRQPVVSQRQMPAAQQPALHMIHKQLPSEVSEELLEQLEQRQTQRTVKVESSEEINRQNIHKTDVTQMERQVVTQTTEDITELVNRTLAKQMRTISDQVYRQMEKRLQTERSRRGRL